MFSVLEFLVYSPAECSLYTLSGRPKLLFFVLQEVLFLRSFLSLFIFPFFSLYPERYTIPSFLNETVLHYSIKSNLKLVLSRLMHSIHCKARISILKSLKEDRTLDCKARNSKTRY